jgi:hypothetical protein
MIERMCKIIYTVSVKLFNSKYIVRIEFACIIHVFAFESNWNHLLHPLQFYKKLSTCLEDVVWKTEDDMTKQEAKWYFYSKILISLWKCNILMSEFLLFQFLYSLFPLLVGLFGHLYISNIYIALHAINFLESMKFM